MSMDPSISLDTTTKKIEHGASEMEYSNCKDLIRDLKKARIAKSYSYNMLFDMLAGTEEEIASSTIANVFAKDSEEKNFNYFTTLLPLKKILLDDEPEEDESYKEILRLQSELKIKEETIIKLNDQIDSLYEQIKQIRDEETRRLTFMKSQIDLKDKRMDTKDELIQRVMDRNDKKDQSIKELMEENKKLEEDLRELMNRCKLCGKQIK